jgi:glycosyltransferase involved in cell wall biosynthesis
MPDYLRILHVADYVMPTMGYQEFMLAKWNARHGHKVHMVTSDRYTPAPDYERTWGPLLGPRIIGPGVEEVEGVEVHRLPCRLELRRRIWLSGFGEEIEKIHPDVILCHGTSSPLAFALPSICRRLKIALLMDNHMAFVAQRRGVSGGLYYLGLRALTRKLLERQVYCFLGVGQECCDFMVQEQGIPAEKVQCLDIGVDTDLFQPDEVARQRLRIEYGIPPEARVVLQTGKLTADKSPHWLSQAMAPVMRQDPGVWLVFVGGAPSDYVDEITSPAAQQGVTDRLRFIPLVPVERLREIFNMADLCVYPNASSLSCMEAASCARPVIVTDLPWGKAREEAGVTLCYQTGNIDDLRQKIERLLSSREKMEAIGQQARAAVLKVFSYDAVAARSEEFMREAIAASNCN